MNKLTTLMAGFCFALTVSSAAAAPQAPPRQALTGTIMGHVRDTKGRPIAQAQVKILETGEIAATDQAGAYIFIGEDPGVYTIKTYGANYQAETLTITVQPSLTQTLDLVLVNASHTSAPIVEGVKGKKLPTAVIEVITSQKRLDPPEDPIANGPLNPFQGDLGLHSTARSR